MKGSVLDVLLICIAIFSVAVIGIIGNTVLSNIEETSNNTQVLNNQSLRTLQQGISAIRIYDTMMPFIFVAFLVASATLAFLIPTHPILIIPSILVIGITVMLAGQLSNLYSDIVVTSSLVTEANNWNITNTIMGNLPLIALMASAVILLAMFAIRKQSEVAT